MCVTTLSPSLPPLLLCQGTPTAIPTSENLSFSLSLSCGLSCDCPMMDGVSVAKNQTAASASSPKLTRRSLTTKSAQRTTRRVERRPTRVISPKLPVARQSGERGGNETRRAWTGPRPRRCSDKCLELSSNLSSVRWRRRSMADPSGGGGGGIYRCAGRSADGGPTVQG